LVDLAEVQAAYYMVAATGVLVAAVYYIITLRSNNKTRRAQMFMQIYDHFNDENFSKHYMNIWGWEMSFKDYSDFKSRIIDNSEKFRSLAVMIRLRRE
jgi:hypothetical protein